MTRQEFLHRCAVAYDAGLVTEDSLVLWKEWADFVLRLEGGHMDMVATFLASEKIRTDFFIHTLSNDRVGYKVVQLAYLLSHPCQTCATDTQGWWSKSGTCTHREGL